MSKPVIFFLFAVAAVCIAMPQPEPGHHHISDFSWFVNPFPDFGSVFKGNFPTMPTIPDISDISSLVIPTPSADDIKNLKGDANTHVKGYFKSSSHSFKSEDGVVTEDKKNGHEVINNDGDVKESSY